jgi:TonB-dependent receptor
VVTAPLPLAPLVFLLAATAAAFSSPLGAQQDESLGAVRGTVYDKDFGSPLPDVHVSIVERQLGATTNENGIFVINRVPEGTYTMTFAKSGYERRVLTNIVITSGRLTDLKADLVTEVYEMEELVVSGLEAMNDSEIAALEIRAESIVLQDSISSELISKAGVSDVGGALKLVVGASVVEGKYATVRGLSDRYTGTTINGIRVPSADPARRAVQVDLFPTGTLESVTVTKTFTPDLQGDFTGGGVDIRTKSVPEGPVLTVVVSVEDDSLATGNDAFLTYDGGGASSSAAGSGNRGLPGTFNGEFPTAPAPRPNPTQQEMQRATRVDRLTRSLEPVLGVEPEKQGYDGSVRVVGGNRYDFGIGRVIGVIGAVTWSHNRSFYEDGLNNAGIISDKHQGIDLDKQRVDTRGSDKTLAGVLGKVVLKPFDGTEFAFEVLHNQSTIDEARYQVHPEGFLGNQVIKSEQNQTLRYIERDVTSLQIRGGHDYDSGARFDWVGAKNFTKQVEPDVRFFRNDFDDRSLTAIKPDNSTEAQNSRRIWRDGRESNYQIAADFRQPFRWSPDLEGSIKTGFHVESTERDYAQDSFTYLYQSPQLPAPAGSSQAVKDAIAFNSSLQIYTGKDRQDLWSNAFLNPDRIGLARNGVPSPDQLLWYLQPTGTDVDYVGNQDIDAVYGMAEIPLLPKLKAVLGARFERTDIQIVPISETGTVDVVIEVGNGDRGLEPRADLEAAADLRDESLLPALGLIYAITPAMNLRANFSRTIARPTFRELAPIVQEEFLLGDEFTGNPELTLSKIANYDIRWEWFPRQGDVLAASVFHKEITDPIEYVTFSVQSNRNLVSPFNFDKGSLTGWELEARTSLDVISSHLAGFSVGVNYTKLDSEVEVPQVEQDALAPLGLAEDKRALQGQPSYIFNANLTWESERSGTSASLFYNLIGEVLLTGASKGPSDGNPSVFEQPSGNLDLTFEQKLGKGWSFSVKGRNLLGDNYQTAYRLPDGDDEIQSQRDLATSWGFSARWSY